MAREKGAKGKESRLRLLHAAAKQFAVHGFHATKVSSIVSEAKLSQPAFYLYFESKDAVFEELVEMFRSNLQEVINNSQLPEQPSARHSALDQLCHTIQSMFEYFYSHPDLTRIGFYLSPDADDIKMELVQGIEKMLRAEQRNANFASEIPMSLVAECLVGTIERIVFTQLLPGTISAEQLAINIVQLYVSGLARKQSKV
ncbi:TetR/AcrR family transcriptional regulator [Paenibacillus sp. WLX1005]|uniref:TetR/AcrR family transcriptional regulator n=1 Tax=unclassified Paenibacillus TaxID=185978 RepID=UPI003984211F